MTSSSPSATRLSAAELAANLRQYSPRDNSYATQFVDCLLASAYAGAASDLHLTPQADGLLVRWRVDGVMESLGLFPPGETTDVVTRLKVMADLLTYRQETPQEGRLRVTQGEVEMRLSTFPTLHGERAVVRLFQQIAPARRLADLGLHGDTEHYLHQKLNETTGAMLITGPAGSGKTTTVYACLSEILQNKTPRNVVTLEDPIECVLPGAAQAAIQPASGFDFATALRSLMRQDPEVILVGEVRDRETAVAAFQAALTGHLIFSTFHAGSTSSAINRLNDMGIESYLILSGLQALLGQRLVRKLCDCAETSSSEEGRLGMEVVQYRVARGCSACGQTGYRGRFVLVEQFPALAGEISAAVLAKAEARAIHKLAERAGMVSLWRRATAAVESGTTSPAEIRRVLGFGDSQTLSDS